LMAVALSPATWSVQVVPETLDESEKSREKVGEVETAGAAAKES
jgi:hypothetical protein